MHHRTRRKTPLRPVLLAFSLGPSQARKMPTASLSVWMALSVSASAGSMSWHFRQIDQTDNQFPGPRLRFPLGMERFALQSKQKKEALHFV